MLTPFTCDELRCANEEWGANCGPGALAAIMGMTLDEVRPHMGDFERKRYTDPRLMNAALRSIGRPWRKIGAVWPSYGLVRVQWEGPWTAPGVPRRARQRYTHWVGCRGGIESAGIFDINVMADACGWCSREEWAKKIVPYILQIYPRASGAWYVTHGIEVERVGRKIARTALQFEREEYELRRM